MEKHSKTKERPGQESLALHLLDLTREEFARAKRNRVYYAGLGRTYGLTNREIGNALGVTEAGVRLMLSRAGV